MKTIDSTIIGNHVTELVGNLALQLTPCTEAALISARDSETLPLPRFALEQMCHNARIARETASPVCQDTGMCIVFIDIGNEIYISGKPLNDAINNGVQLGYSALRKSVCGALSRINTTTNCPAIIHSRIVCGDTIKLSVMLKGFGSENMSRLYMLTPSAGIEGVKAAIIETAAIAGSNPCPPIIVGVGIGGDMEYACIMAKRALLRTIGSTNCDASLIALESELLTSVNSLGIGAQGLGGKATCLSVFIEEFPTHISAIPVAINIQCHAARHGSVIIK